jgi:hypothetical protein
VLAYSNATFARPDLKQIAQGGASSCVYPSAALACLLCWLSSLLHLRLLLQLVTLASATCADVPLPS